METILKSGTSVGAEVAGSLGIGKNPFAFVYYNRDESDLQQAKQELNDLAKYLVGDGSERSIRNADRNTLEAFCRCYARLVDANCHIAIEGQVVMARSGEVVQNPYMAIAGEAMYLLLRFGNEFWPDA